MNGRWRSLVCRSRFSFAVAGVVLPATLLFFATFAATAFAGNFFATGHDQDLHCAGGETDECSYYAITTNFVRAGSTLPVLILDRGALEAVSALNLAYSNNQSSTPTASSPPYVVEDPQGIEATQINGSPPPGITTGSTWAATPLVDGSGHPLWSAIIVASDASCGGCDLNNTDDGSHPDSDAINARTSAIQAFFNVGGGLLYLAGADNSFDADGVAGKDVYYASVPVTLTGVQVSEPFTVTPEGAALGITDAMANCCATHNSFSLPPAGSTIKVAETDSAGSAESLFVQNGNVCSGSFCSPPPPPPPPTKPGVQSTNGTSSSSSAAGFSGTVAPGGLPTTAHFDYGLDSRYTNPGTSGPVYDHSTPDQSVGSDFSLHPVSASVAGLVPNALYHVRLVATNSAGTTFGPDMTFTTPRGPAPAPPALGKSFTGSATGLVLILVNGKFVPITELSKIPNGAVIDALHGTLTLNTAGGTQHATLAAKKGKKPKKPKTQTGKFGGAVFKVTQTHSGLATLALVEGAKFKGAPTFASCTTKKGKAVTAAVSKKTLQLLHGSAHGKFRTKGRYSAATIRGTIWTIADRCDGTLVHAIKDVVTVDDFVRHKTIALHPGHSYLALAHPPKVKKRETHK